MNIFKKTLLAGVVLLAGVSVGCIGPVASGNFDRTLTVTGPGSLYLSNGSGSTQIHAGAPGQIHIHGEFRLRGWLWGNPHRSAAELSENPPIRQEGSLVHVGSPQFGVRSASINYTIEVPPNTEVRVTTGSGDVNVGGIAGPVTATTGSGDVQMSEIQGDVHVTAGSGDMRMDGIKGSAEVTAGSGDVEMKSVGGRVRVKTGSGDITLSAPGNAVTLSNGSGDIRVTGASSDLRVRTGSGTVSVSGSPSAGSYWELHAASGDVALNVPSTAAFRFHAQSRMGDIQSRLPMTIVEKSRHELRAVIGQGSARVEVETGTGDIRLNSSQP
jgi:hypothetical protein